MNLRTIASLTVGIGILIVMLSVPVWADDSPAGITVVGSGVLHQPPTILVVAIDVGAVGSTADGAVTRMASRTEAFLSEFRRFGLTADDWDQTMTIRRRTVPDEPKELAFWATTTLTVRLDAFESAPDMLDLATEMNASRVDFEFMLDDPQVAYERALKRALADARFKADMLARETGMAIGGLLACEELTVPPMLETHREPDAGHSDDSVSEDTPPVVRRSADLTPHDIVTVATVRARFALTQ